MTTGEVLILASLGTPLAAAGSALIFARMRDVRDTVTVVAALALTSICAALLVETTLGRPPEMRLAEPIPGLAIFFRLEPLGALFAAMASALYLLNSLYSIGYMRARREPRQGRFYACFGLAMCAVSGVAMAGNLFTAFLFYELLTFATYPLVTHKGDETSRRAGRLYVLLLGGSAAALLLPAVATIQAMVGSTEFVTGGLLAGRMDACPAGVLLIMLVFGTAKAALMPLHAWLPGAMAAPTPVSAFLHAVAVVKTGVFLILKCAAGIFGPEIIATSPAAQGLLWVAAATILVASVTALTRDDLKERLAWSTVSQLSYIISGALIAVGAGVVGGGLHMLTHAFGKITMFMCVGAIYLATGVTRVSSVSGLARRMPLVFAAFLVGSLSVIGLPPFGGMWSKFLLITAAFGAEQPVTAAAMILSSLLSAACFLPIVISGFLGEPGEAALRSGPVRAPFLAVLPPVVTAAGCFGLFFIGDWVMTYLIPIAERAP
jgi:multicomponent Na+:H+ antiporter subunit D